MRHARVLGFAGLAVATVVAITAIAQTTVEPLPEAAPAAAMPLDATVTAELAKAKPGDATAGAAKAGACVACHGLDGNATDPTLYPRLAGQSERYLSRQLALFKSGERANPIMQPFAMALSAQDMRDIGAYYASKSVGAGAGIADDAVIADKNSPYDGMKFFEVGQKLYRSGDPARNLPACMACHGPSGAGNPGPAYPRVAGQQAWYTARRLQEYRAGTTNELDKALFETMSQVAKPLTDQEIQALASYMQGLHRRSAGG
ncbi:MAG: c-type cytochrome [Lysobacter sp.]|nr:MAG: c-type cytochrome [Lysobacter sp.]